MRPNKPPQMRSGDCVGDCNVTGKSGAVRTETRYVVTNMRKAALGVLVPLRRGECVQPQRLAYVLRHAYASLKHEAEVELSAWQVVGGSKLVQPHRFRYALWHSKPVVIPVCDEAAEACAVQGSVAAAYMNARLLFARGRPCAAARWYNRDAC
jgi:hypothetical protein